MTLNNPVIGLCICRDVALIIISECALSTDKKKFAVKPREAGGSLMRLVFTASLAGIIFPVASVS